MRNFYGKLGHWWINLTGWKLEFFNATISFVGVTIFFIFHRIAFLKLAKFTYSSTLADGAVILISALFPFAFLRFLVIHERGKEELRLTHEKLKEAHSLLKVTSLKDSLTGLYNNRDFMLEEIQRSLAFAKRNNEELVFFFIDLDKLKDINAKYSHPAGDTAIKTTGDITRSVLREEIALFRFGGDEFFAAIRFKKTPDIQANIDNLASRIKEAVLNSHCYSEGVRIPISVTVGTKIVDPQNSIKNELTAVSKAMLSSKGN